MNFTALKQRINPIMPINQSSIFAKKRLTENIRATKINHKSRIAGTIPKERIGLWNSMIIF